MNEQQEAIRLTGDSVTVNPVVVAPNVDGRLNGLLDDLRMERDTRGRSEHARSLSILITDLEKVLAYYSHWVANREK